MKRKHKIYSRPKRPFDKARIDEEVIIKEKYGLKNKKEIWRADAKVRIMRQKAKTLIKASEEEKQALFEQLKKISFYDSVANRIRNGRFKGYSADAGMGHSTMGSDSKRVL